MKSNLLDLFYRISETEGNVIIFGAGDVGHLIFQFFESIHYPISLFIDNDNSKKGTTYKSKRIASPIEAVQKYPDGHFIITSFIYGDEMSLQLQNMGIKKEKIVICDTWTIIEMKNALHHQFKIENKNFIFHQPSPKISFVKWMKILLNIKKYKILMNIVHPKDIQQKQYNVVLCAIFKNEGYYLREWIEYHKLIGIEHFFLYNNLSSDNYMEILETYIQSNEVTLIDWPYYQKQIEAYKDCIKGVSDKCKWIGFIDLDEFIVPIKDNNIYDFLKKFEKNRGSVLIYWKIFGSGGKLRRDNTNLVTEDFTVCWRKHSDTGKCFFNTNYNLANNKKNSTMHHIMWTEYKGIQFPPVNIFDKVCFDGIHFASKKEFPIQINHYVIKSYEEYQTKMQGTDVYFRNNPHNNNAFLFHDQKCGAIDVSIYKYLTLLKRTLSGKTKLH